MLRLPHPELIEWLGTVKRNLCGARTASVAGTELHYEVFRLDPDTTNLGACYDVDGTIYLPEGLVRFDARYADLIAYHEYEEIRHKRAGRSHAYAHRRALIEELLVAKRVLDEPAAHRRFLEWRIGGYPESKVPDAEPVVAQFALLLAGDRPRKGDLLRVIREHRL